MATNIVIPQMGESVVEATIGKWLKKEGDPVKKDEPVVEIMTDKINAEIPAHKSGVLGKILIGEGTVVPIGAEIGVLLDSANEPIPEKYLKGNGGGVSAIHSGAQTPSAPSAAPAPFAPGVEEEDLKGVKTSPAVRRLAREHGIDLTQIKGTGGGGRITKEDVEAFIATGKKAPAMAPSAPGKAPAAPSGPKQPIPSAPTTRPTGPREETVPYAGVRKVIGDHMVKSKQTAMHYTTFDDCDFSSLVELRTRMKPQIQEKYGVNLTYLPFIIKAACFALKEFPVINAFIMGDKIVYKKYYNIGVAVGRDSGLIVPVIKEADTKNVLQLAAEIATLSAKAHADKLTLNDIQGGTF
ncbi:MAG TPA: dihydrolipoamide acetyltransferase family protein, partial [candidate division Zixibacteria bacterium]|nr:dihydrolipoamide acetyltransferase family protein [candidate division Zixibacteria bacterium]